MYTNSRVDLQEVQDGFMSERGILLGGFKEDCQDTQIDLEISEIHKGLNAKQPRASSSSGQMRGRRGWLPSPVIRAPRARLSWGEGKGGLGNPTGGLTDGFDKEGGRNSERGGGVWAAGDGLHADGGDTGT
jgi:hypothetical protein